MAETKRAGRPQDPNGLATVEPILDLALVGDHIALGFGHIFASDPPD
jgi:hypothetical protein